MSVESEMEVAGGGSPRDDVPLLPLILEDSGGDRMAAATWLGCGLLPLERRRRGRCFFASRLSLLASSRHFALTETRG